MTDVGELTVRIKADAAQLEREMRKATGVVKSGAGEMSGSLGTLTRAFAGLIPALSAAALVSFGKRAVDAAGHVNDLAGRIGFAASTLFALESPLVQNGSNLDEFSASINLMNNTLGEAAKGNEEAIKSFDALGLSVNRLKKLGPEQQFYEVTKALGLMNDQFAQTEAGRNIFGRGFATMLPLLKQYRGDMEKAVAAQEELGNKLDKGTIDRIDQFGDSMSEAGLKIEHTFLKAFAAVLRTIDAISEVTAKPATNAKSGMPGENPLPQAYLDKANRLGMATSATFVGKDAYGPAYQAPDAKGDNKALLGAKDAAEAAKARAKQIKDATAALEDYNRTQAQEGVLLAMTTREAAMQEARFKAEEIARKGNIKLTREQTEAAAARAAKNYDVKKAQDEVNKATEEAARVQQVLHDKLSATLTDIAFKAGSAKEAMLAFAEFIAKAAFEKRVAGPLADALVGTGGKSGLLDGAIGGVGKFFGGFFADGGSPPVGVPSVVGERGPEIFVPNTAGTIIPNGRTGGTSVYVSQTFSLNPGASEQTVAALRNLVPAIMAETKAGVFAAMRQGGPASRITGLRN